MKTHLIPLVLLGLVVAPQVQAADSKRTAEYILSTPAEFEGKQVTLDVAFVQPTHWKSPIPELAFFHAITVDRRERQHGGSIMVVVDAASAASFAKKYGTDFERGESSSLTGVLVSTPPRPKMPGQFWILDTTGKAKELMASGKLEIPQEKGPGMHWKGPRREGKRE